MAEPGASGQNVQRSSANKLRQDKDQDRPSSRLRREDEPPPLGGEDPGAGPTPSGKQAALEDKRLKKSKLRMEKSETKLDKACDKLAAQKPLKAPGPLKKLSQAARAEAWAYAHGKVYQVEDENVGVKAAHRTELVGEASLHGGARFVKHRIRTRPARRVRKWEKKNIKARAGYQLHTLAQENPELKKSAVSRYLQKRRIKRQYQKQARDAVKMGARAAQKTAFSTGKIARAAVFYLKRNPTALVLALCLFLLVIILQSCVSAMMSAGNGATGAVFGTSYLAEDADIDRAELAYTEWEADITLAALNAESSHPGYDEYNYYIDPTGHDPHALLAFLTAKYDDFTFTEVEPVLRDIFAQQYTLTFTRIVEVRSYTEHWTDEDGSSHSETVYYNYYILDVTLTARPFEDIIAPMLETQDEQDRYDVYMLIRGNRQYVGSPFSFNWLPHVSSYYGYRVHPISGEKDYHTGVDIAMPTGTEIQAGGKGVVLAAGTNGGYGLCVVIDYGKGVTARYAHCSALLVRIGQAVERGQAIALVGNTGNSTGPHLHLEVMKDGRYLNPLYFAVIPFD